MIRKRPIHSCRLFFLILLFLAVLCNVCLAQHFTDLAVPDLPAPAPTASASAPPLLKQSLPEPVSGRGRLTVSIESFKGANPRRISQLADRVEIWLGDKRLAAMNYSDPEVVTEKNRRIFLFPELEFDCGYYFITVRLYSPAALYGRDKWHGEIFQVGIHPDITSRVYKKIAFFHY